MVHMFLLEDQVAVGPGFEEAVCLNKYNKVLFPGQARR